MTAKTNRTFTDSVARRERVPLLIGLVGPSGGGKTWSGLELLHGIQEVTGGDIGVIDTEARRALHYAGVTNSVGKPFTFRHLPFEAPFGPMDYLAAIEHLYKAGVRNIMVDSMSHEHEGPGGVLEMHDAELQRLAGDDFGRRAKMTMLAWQKPKAERRALLNAILQMPVNFVFCFRAKEKIKMQPGKDPLQLGWQPIAGEEFVFEMTLNCLLPPGANGVPEWSPEEKAERQMIKLPQQFRPILTPGRPLSIEVGRELARWAEGGAVGQVSKPAQAAASVPSPSPEVLRMAELQDLLDQWETRLKPQGVAMSKDAIARQDHAAILRCLTAIRPVVEAFKADGAS